MNSSSVEIIRLLPVLLGGGILGAIFFGGLWWTVHKGLGSSHVGIWFFTSSLLRLSLAVVGFYFISDGQWPRLAVCLLGFIMARFLVIKLSPEHIPLSDVNHAP